MENPILALGQVIDVQVLKTSIDVLRGIIIGLGTLFLMIYLIRGYADPKGEKRTGWIVYVVLILVILMLVSFIPDFVNWASGVSGNGSIATVS